MRLVSTVFFLFLLQSAALAICPPLPQDIPQAAVPSMEPAKTDKCPVCGMFVAKYPDWLARVVFQNGDTVYFDGAKDMFKFLLDLDKYRPGASRADLAGIHVTEYYKLRPVDARSAYFVLGSDIYGPMGRELIPLETCEDAETFLKDHKGARIIIFQDVTPALLKALD